MAEEAAAPAFALSQAALFGLANAAAEFGWLPEIGLDRVRALALRAEAADALGLSDLAFDDRLDVGVDAAERTYPVEASLIGDFEFRVNGRVVPAHAWPNRRAATMLRVLATSGGRPLHRAQLVDWLWTTDATRGERSFRVAVSVIRRGLEDAGAPRTLLARLGDRYALEPMPLTDLDRFEHHLARAVLAWSVGRLRVARRRLDVALDMWSDATFLPADVGDPWTYVHRRRVEAMVNSARGLAVRFEADPRLAGRESS